MLIEVPIFMLIDVAYFYLCLLLSLLHDVMQWESGGINLIDLQPEMQ